MCREYVRREESGKTPTTDVVFEDFEDGYANWTIEGTAFGAAPAKGTLPGQQAVSGFAGNKLVNSFVGGDDAMVV